MLARKEVRLVAALVAVLLLVSGCGWAQKYYGVKTVTTDADARALATKLFGPVDQMVLTSHGLAVLSPAENGSRTVGFLASAGAAYKLVGPRHQIAAGADAHLEVAENLAVVRTYKEKAPQYTAYQIGTGGLAPVDYYTVRAPEPSVKTGHLVVLNKELNALWHYRDGKLVKAYRVATGRQTQPPVPTWDDYKTNFFTPEGTFTLDDFKRNPPYNALKPGDKSYPGGAPGNPLGTRWMGFSVLPGDGSGIWGVHGTSDPDKIGTWASDGCIRMYTEQAEKLFDQLQGTNAVIQIVGR